ncbi:hypothetical protein [Motiliproteus sp. MSK22-1]|uniref:hypothetical protein n=1 Tax=Motiliproteus sp. MSK22-1 TaxID=1897630 RepID=UPI0009768A1F|nr:hypothetical protein [Motiliproteus sp. MSK22-1]OMH31651.1 hypothetical protein BGP75_16095 [Motiliproteus sp. MSK22-1]
MRIVVFLKNIFLWIIIFIILSFFCSFTEMVFTKLFILDRPFSGYDMLWIQAIPLVLNYGLAGIVIIFLSNKRSVYILIFGALEIFKRNVLFRTFVGNSLTIEDLWVVILPELFVLVGLTVGWGVAFLMKTKKPMGSD